MHRVLAKGDYRVKISADQLCISAGCGAILDNLRTGLVAGEVYAWAGPTLLAVNPMPESGASRELPAQLVLLLLHLLLSGWRVQVRK